MRAHVGGAHGHDRTASHGPAEHHLPLDARPLLLLLLLLLLLRRGDLRVDLGDLRDLRLARGRRLGEALLKLSRRATRPRRLVRVRSGPLGSGQLRLGWVGLGRVR